MSNSVLELRLTRSMPIKPNENVIFDEETISSPGITYDSSSGEITINETGQYSIKWWVSTETTLKGVMVFDLFSSQGSLAPGCSPIKTGQIAGFGVIDVTAAATTLALINRSLTDTVLSRKTRTKAYLLITPIGGSGGTAHKVYRGNLSASGSFMQVPLGNEVYYRLEYLSSTQIRLFLTPMNGDVVYDYRRYSAFDGGSTQGSSADSATMTGAVTIDADIYNNSREMHWVVVRVKNPDTELWSTYEVRLFASGAGARVLVWVNTIEEGVSY